MSSGDPTEINFARGAAEIPQTALVVDNGSNP